MKLKENISLFLYRVKIFIEKAYNIFISVTKEKMSNDKLLKIQFNPTLDVFIKDRLLKELTIISGVNNSGKSLILKILKSKLGESAYLIGVNRFSHISQLNMGNENQDELFQLNQQHNRNLENTSQNQESNILDLNRIFSILNDEKRDELFKICEDLLGNKFEIKKVKEDNILSPYYIDMNGENLAYGSSGVRLLMTILGICFDNRFNILLIDEPELGLSPKIQNIFFSFIKNKESRAKYFPHLKHIIIVTHSHLFLDSDDVTNNFKVNKKDNIITLNQIKNFKDFHYLQFNLLGNSFESLFLPSAIIIVEGISDYKYLEEIFIKLFPKKRISIFQANGDNMVKVLIDIKQLIGNIDDNPLKSRLFIVLDKVHSVGEIDRLKNEGAYKENIIEWEKNGIEYVYPKNILAKIFHGDEETIINDIMIKGDIISHESGVKKDKNTLAKEIVNSVTSDTIFPEEFMDKLIIPLSKAMD